jgi:Tol biopolymer transport system component
MCDSEGQNLTQLTFFGKGFAGTPQWSPNGEQIAFDYRASGGADVFVLDVGGGVPRRITIEPSDDSVPSWSRDGRYLYFASNRTGDQQIWKVPAEGGSEVQITMQGGFTAFESADGTALYYSRYPVASGVWRVPVQGGPEVLVLDQPGAGIFGQWSLLADGIYFVKQEAEEASEIGFFSFATQRTTQVVELHQGWGFLSGLAVSPDRRCILYTHQDPISSDIMLVENFH